ncbi:MAG: hypothetical protein COB53_12805 [Elusimicrobia bacterium]|nr:MAG: hypothetical protein COB53_12805 [Elusimicrobiota bacterium]
MRYVQTKHIDDFSRSQTSLEVQPGELDEYSTAIGHTAIWFSGLEENVSTVIHNLLRLDTRVGKIVTEALSFKTKVQLMASLAAKWREEGCFKDSPDHEEFLDELVKRCFKAEELKNQILHSSSLETFFREKKPKRRKVPAKHHHATPRKAKTINSSYLLDAADFICKIGLYVEAFAFEVQSEVGSSQK